MHSISFRPLQSTDFAMLHDWLCRPHVAEWWTPLPTLAEVEADFTPMLAAESPDRGYIALRDGQPLGFIQSYVVMGSGDGWWEDERDPGARGIDQFLAQADQLNRGLGSAMVRAFTDQLFADPAVTRVQTDPSPPGRRTAGP